MSLDPLPSGPGNFARPPERSDGPVFRTEEILETIFNNIHLLVAVLDHELRFVRVNRTYAQADGRSVDFYPGKNHFDLFPNEENEGLFREVLHTGRPRIVFERPFRYAKHPDRGVTYWDWSLMPLSTPDGETTGLVLSLLDVTERVRMRQASEKHESMYHLVSEHMNEVVWTADPEDRLTYVSPSCSPLLGHDPESLVGRPLGTLVHPRSRDSVAETFKARKAGIHRGAPDTPARPTWTAEMELLTADGGAIWAEATVGFLRSSEGSVEGALGVVRDISERKSLEKSLMRAQKMEAVGRLAGGVAHDFNNMMHVIKGYARRLQRHLPEESREAAWARDIEAAGVRAAAITRQLRALGRVQVLRPRPINLNDVAHAAAAMFAAGAPENVEIRFELGEDVPVVHADPDLMEQVVLNLMLNGRDAMPAGGVLTLRTEQVRVWEFQNESDLAPGWHAVLEVSDNGEGMDEETLSHIFEPFFSTKPAEKESRGLGLAMAFGTVGQSGGVLDAESTPGEGSTFRILLPADPTAVATKRRKNSAPSQEDVSGRGGRLLVVEDDDLVRNFMADELRDLGFDVIEASTGALARDELAAADALPELLVTDVLLPDMTGPEVYETLRTEHPALRVLYMSGHTEKFVEQHGYLEKGEGFLEKPFQIEELVREIRRALARR